MHLSQLRRAARHAELSMADYDSAEIALRASPTDPSSRLDALRHWDSPAATPARGKTIGSMRAFAGLEKLAYGPFSDPPFPSSCLPEFQLGADILSTAIAPSWEQIGRLGAIAVIRTGLTYFLTREMREERERTGVAGETDGSPVPELKPH